MIRHKEDRIVQRIGITKSLPAKDRADRMLRNCPEGPKDDMILSFAIIRNTSTNGYPFFQLGNEIDTHMGLPIRCI